MVYKRLEASRDSDDEASGFHFAAHVIIYTQLGVGHLWS